MLLMDVAGVWSMQTTSPTTAIWRDQPPEWSCQHTVAHGRLVLAAEASTVLWHQAWPAPTCHLLHMQPPKAIRTTGQAGPAVTQLNRL